MLRIELGELTAELDLDIIGRLDSLSQSLSSTPDSRDSPTKTPVSLETNVNMTLTSQGHTVLYRLCLSE